MDKRLQAPTIQLSSPVRRAVAAGSNCWLEGTAADQSLSVSPPPGSLSSWGSDLPHGPPLRPDNILQVGCITTCHHWYASPYLGPISSPVTENDEDAQYRHAHYAEGHHPYHRITIAAVEHPEIVGQGAKYRRQLEKQHDQRDNEHEANDVLPSNSHGWFHSQLMVYFAVFIFVYSLSVRLFARIKNSQVPVATRPTGVF